MHDIPSVIEGLLEEVPVRAAGNYAGMLHIPGPNCCADYARASEAFGGWTDEARDLNPIYTFAIVSIGNQSEDAYKSREQRRSMLLHQKNRKRACTRVTMLLVTRVACDEFIRFGFVI